MIEMESKDLEEVKRILRAHLPQAEVWAFGSRVKGTQQEYSDLDLAVITSTPLGVTKISAIREAFSLSDLPIMVDIVDWSAIDEEFREVIRAEHCVVET